MVAGRPELLRTTRHYPASAGSRHAALSGNEHLVPAPPIGPQGPSDQPFVMADVTIVEAVDVGGVDQRYSRVERGMDHPNALLLGWPLLNREVHPPLPDGRHLRSVATELAARNH